MSYTETFSGRFFLTTFMTEACGNDGKELIWINKQSKEIENQQSTFMILLNIFLGISK